MPSTTNSLTKKKPRTTNTSASSKENPPQKKNAKNLSATNTPASSKKAKNPPAPLSLTTNTSSRSRKPTEKGEAASQEIRRQRKVPVAIKTQDIEDSDEGDNNNNAVFLTKYFDKVAMEEEAAENRKTRAARKQFRAQQKVPKDEDRDGDVFEDDEGLTISSRPVISKLTVTKEKNLIRSEGRMPIARKDLESSQEGDIFFEDEDRTSTKKHRSPSPEDLRDAQVQRTSKSRPKRADYDDTTQACIIQSIHEYRCKISADVPFPDHAEETQMARISWDESCRELRVNLALTPRIMKVITNRGSHTRGELKTKARPIVDTYYHFESGQNRKIIASNREIAEGLKDQYGYAYKIHDTDHKKRKGLYQNPLIQKIVNTMWFRNRKDEGVVFDDYFNPLRLETIGLVLTVIECCIDEWITGIKTDIAFTGAAYREVYVDHVKCLMDFDSHSRANNVNILGNIQEKLYNRGRFHAGAQPLSKVGIRALPKSAFDAAIKEHQDDSETETDGESGGIGEY